MKEGVNTQVGFETALAKAVGRELTDEEKASIKEGDRDVQSGLVFGGDQESPPTPQSDEESDEVEEEVAPEGEEEEETPSEDDEVASLRKQLADAQAMIGRQGQEKGELNTKLQEQAERLARLEGFAESFEAEPAVDQAAYQRVDAFAEEERGEDAVQYAAETGDTDLIDYAVDKWLEEGDPRATRYAIKWEAWKQNNLGEQEETETKPAEVPQEIQALAVQTRQANAVGSLREEMGAEKFDAIWAHVPELSEKLPPSIKQVFGEQLEGTEAEMKAALKGLLDLAAPLANVKAVVSAERVEKKKAAQVHTGSQQRQPGSGKGVTGESSSEEKRAWLHEQILATPSTSVADSIEYKK